MILERHHFIFIIIYFFSRKCNLVSKDIMHHSLQLVASSIIQFIRFYRQEHEHVSNKGQQWDEPADKYVCICLTVFLQQNEQKFPRVWEIVPIIPFQRTARRLLGGRCVNITMPSNPRVECRCRQATLRPLQRASSSTPPHPASISKSWLVSSICILLPTKQWLGYHYIYLHAMWTHLHNT